MKGILLFVAMLLLGSIFWWMQYHLRGLSIDNDIKLYQLERRRVLDARADAEYKRKELARKQKEADEREYAERRIKEIGGAK